MTDLSYPRQLLENGDLARAEAEYRRLVADPASRSEALYGLGLVSFRRRDYDAAEKWFGKSLAVRPGGDNPLYFLGEIASVRGDRNEAIRLYATVLAQNPTHVGALNRIASFANVQTAGQRPHAGVASPAAPRTHRPQVAAAPPPAPANLRPPRPPTSRRSTVGIAEQVKLQVIPFNGQAAARQLLTLRVRVVGEDGQSGRLVGIEMRGFKIRGSVENGDWVEVDGGIERSGKIRSFRNLTTDVVVRSGLF